MVKKFRNKETGGVTHPMIRKIFNSKYPYILLALSLVASVLYGYQETKNTIKDIGKPLPVENAYQSIKASDSNAIKWAKDFVKQKPSTESKWNVSSSIAPLQPIDFKECNSFTLLDPSVLGSTRAEGDNVKVTTQIYSTAQANSGFSKYQSIYSKCWNLQSEKIGNPQTIVEKYSKGFFFNYGDAIIFVSHSDSTNQDELIDYYVNLAAKTLKEYQCNSLTSSNSDSTRSIYFNASNYKGYWLSKTIGTQVKLNNIPNPIYQSINDVSYMQEPEAPLPSNLPKLPSKTPEKPSIPTNPDDHKPNFTKNISYQAADPIGPSCGWSWLGFKEPKVNNSQLQAIQKQLEINALNSVNAIAQGYVNSKLDYSRSLIALMDKIESWNSYANTVKNVNDKWTWLNNQRNTLKPLWDNYVTSHNTWINFDNLKTNAINDYNKQVDECNAQNKAVSDWDSKYGQLSTPSSTSTESSNSSSNNAGQNSVQANPTTTDTGNPNSTDASSTDSPSASSTASPTSTDNLQSNQDLSSPSVTSTSMQTTDLPPRPSACTNTPVLPDIANQDKGDEPQPPTIPSGVTIPNSWSKPDTQPTVEIKK